MKTVQNFHNWSKCKDNATQEFWSRELLYNTALIVINAPLDHPWQPTRSGPLEAWGR